MSTETSSTTGFWAILELFGHTKLAGHVTEYQFGGTNFIRVDVPETRYHPAFSKMLNHGAVYAINPVEEEISRMQAERLSVSPLERYELSYMLDKKLKSEGLMLAPQSETVMSKAQHSDDEDLNDVF